MLTIYRLTTVVLLVLTLARGTATSPQSNQWLSYEPAIVELEGRLIVERKFGPPNFGENPKTDAKMRVPILVLAKPINIHGNKEYFPFDVEIKGVRRIQLLLLNVKGPYTHFVGKKVLVEGGLSHAFTGGHYTDVVMDVHSINQVPERRRRQRR
jgi:Domain of unknown function (DUF4431)